ncbi:transmembrane protein 241 isoform X2 [Hippoglossus hippoglossus]|uniref:transmembrane protein 241 isoform X2 n=1 Tax=Hippoglossus hippoglossus TaxID=8267 RepID=UPI00148C1F1E|nr:transmembrane protein 241 isoform X2 [Hippoglossus hippoglossus]
MSWRRHISGCVFSLFFVVSYFTNKFVLSVLKFTYPTLFQGWQTFIGALLLLLFGKLGWVEMSRITRSAALPWLPASLLFVGNIYAGSRALSHIKMRWMTFISICLMLLSAINLPLYDPQFDNSGYLWAVAHLFCVGAYRVFQVHYKPRDLSDLEIQCINYLFSVLLLAAAAHPTGDLMAAMEFPSLQSYTFHCGCCASALLGFFLLLATVKLKSGISLEHFGIWCFISKVSAVCLSPLVFSMEINAPSLICVLGSHVGEALLVYSEREPQL